MRGFDIPLEQREAGEEAHEDGLYLEAACVECEGLSREQLVRRIAGLMRRLDSETQRAERWCRDYQRIAFPPSESSDRD